MEVSHSKCATARGCWKKFYWKYIKNIEPIKQSNALTIGKTIHEAFELYYKGFSDENCHQHIEDQFDLAMSQAGAVDQEGLLISKYTTLGMWDFYPHKKLDNFESIVPEVNFKVRIGNTRSYFVGKIDGHVIQNKIAWVREVKTTGLSHKQFVGRMRTSAQATGYVYSSYKMDFPVKGVMFDVIRKSLLRKRDSETADQFGKRIYEDYRWRSGELYLRHYEYRNPETLEIFEEDLIHFLKDMRSHVNRNKFYRNCEQCWNFNSECPYMKICFAKEPDALTLQLLYKEGSHGGKYGGTRTSAGATNGA